MLDFVYSGIAPEGTSHLGAQIFHCTTRFPLGLSVRYRRSLLRAYLDDTVIRIPQARILSVASGHCRELDGSLLSSGVMQPEYIALDQDRDACALVEREYGRPWVRVIPSGIRSLLGDSSHLGQFDFIYSAGLFDYLSDAVARTLLERLCAMLRPKGRLLFANFLPSCFGRGYLEGMMDWHLTFRTDRELLALLPKGVSTSKAFEDPHGNVVYVEATPPPTRSSSSRVAAR
jgi:SAM-dependent methyltransferase